MTSISTVRSSQLAFPISFDRLSSLSYISVSSSGINVHRRPRKSWRKKSWQREGTREKELLGKRLNRGQKVFDVVLLINLRSPGHECHSEGNSGSRFCSSSSSSNSRTLLTFRQNILRVHNSRNVARRARPNSLLLSTILCDGKNVYEARYSVKFLVVSRSFAFLRYNM